MDEEELESMDEISKMFVGDSGKTLSDQDLALHLIHRFNIDRDTFECMPAFKEPLKPLFFGKNELE